MHDLPTIALPTTVLALPCGASIDTGEGITLTVQQRGWPVGTTQADLNMGALAENATLTEDGRGYDPRWHDGRSARQVYTERWTREGRVFHGWIDSRTRRIVQAG